MKRIVNIGTNVLKLYLVTIIAITSITAFASTDKKIDVKLSEKNTPSIVEKIEKNDEEINEIISEQKIDEVIPEKQIEQKEEESVVNYIPNEEVVENNTPIEEVKENNTQKVEYNEPVYVEPKITGNSISISNILYNNLMKDYTGDNFYLNHDINGVNDGRGVPYIDFRTDFTTRKTIIYSHSSPNGNGPFQVLQNYHNNKSFYDNNKYITINYNGVTYTYLIFSVYVSVANSEQDEGLEYFHKMYYTDSSWDYTINKYKNNSDYDTGVSVNSNDKILILQTCSMDPNYYKKYYRYNLVIMGKLI